MIRIVIKDISEVKTFEKYGDIFNQIKHNEETGWWLYERTNKETGKKHYEVVRGVKKKNPDGTIVYAYPSSEMWGTYGYTIPDNRYAEKVIEFMMGAKARTLQEILDFKRSLIMPLFN